MAFASVSNVQDYMEDPDLGPDIRVKATLNTAGRIVEDLAPPDVEPPTAGYVSAAKDTELMLFEYLWTTKGFISSQSSVVGSSQSFQSDAGVINILRHSMGDWFVEEGQESGVDDGIGHVGRATF